MKRFATFLVLVATLTFAAQAHAAAAPLKIAIVSRTVFFAPLWAAQHQGYFRAAGVDAEITVYDNAELISDAIRSGREQIAISTPEGVVLDAYVGGPLRLIAGNAERLPHFIIAAPRIRSLGDLRGARIGVLSLKEGTSYLVGEIAKAAGLGPADYQILQVGGAPTRARLLQEGAIDAGLQPFPLSYDAEAAGFSNLGPASAYVPDYLFTAVSVDGRWAGRNRATVIAFLGALRRGQDFLAEHPDEAAAIVAGELRTTPALARRALGDAARLRILSLDLSVSKPALARLFEGLKATEQLPAQARLDPSKVIDESFLRASRLARPASTRK